MDVCDGVPDIGEVFEVDGYRFKVQSMRGRRISLIRVIAPEEPEPAAAEEAAQGSDAPEDAESEA